MNHPENNTILNDFITLMNSRMGSINQEAQLTTSIINSISTSKKKIKPLRNPQLCNFPSSNRKDDFNFNDGLGSVSLQGSVDQLNNFKQMCIRTIKTKYEAMGPEAAKDANLAIGAATIIKEILEAAKCFTQIVKNVNNLIDSYIQSIAKMATLTTSMISQLEADIANLKQIIIIQCRLSTLIPTILLDQLAKTTDILSILSIINSIQNELNSARLELNYLSQSDERIYLQLDTSLTMIRNRIDNFLRYSLLLNSLNKNSEKANSLYMTDDFLDDLDLKDKEASSFNWSVTNNNALAEYNLYDELNVIPRLNQAFKNYKSKTESTVVPVVIASKTENGYIIMPESEESLISCGIDTLLQSNVGLVLELSINHGETVIRAIARGGIAEADGSIKKVLGEFISRGVDNIEYTTLIKLGTYEWKLLTNLNTNSVSLGDKYTFYDPVLQSDWQFSYTDNVTGDIYRFPVLFEVFDKTHNTVSVRMLIDGIDFIDSNYITSTNPFTYTNTYTDLPTLDSENKYVCVVKIGNNYVLADTNNNPITTPVLAGDPENFKTRYMSTADLPIDPGLNDITALNWEDGGYTVLKYYTYSFLLRKYNKSGILGLPHAGEKIPCLNWSLSAYPLGEDSVINTTQFSGTYPNDDVYTFFLKAHWGFIPETISTEVITQTTQQQKQTFVNNHFFKLVSTR